MQEIKRKNGEAIKRMMADKEVEDCTFTPVMPTKKKGDQARDINHFLEDQQKYLEGKNMKAAKRKQDVMEEEDKQIKTGPMLDQLSSQIVEMMSERKGIKTGDRLYLKGQEKLRKIAADEQLKKEQEQ